MDDNKILQKGGSEREIEQQADKNGGERSQQTKKIEDFDPKETKRLDDLKQETCPHRGMHGVRCCDNGDIDEKHDCLKVAHQTKGSWEGKELPPIEDKIQQVFKFLEIADIGEFHGKNVFEAGDADSLHDILETAFEQVHHSALESQKREMREKIEGMVKAVGEPEGFGESATWSKGRKEALDDILNLLK